MKSIITPQASPVKHSAALFTDSIAFINIEQTRTAKNAVPDHTGTAYFIF